MRIAILSLMALVAAQAADKRTSANGKKIPANARVATFTVW